MQHPSFGLTNIYGQCGHIGLTNICTLKLILLGGFLCDVLTNTFYAADEVAEFPQEGIELAFTIA